MFESGHLARSQPAHSQIVAIVDSSQLCAVTCWTSTMRPYVRIFNILLIHHAVHGDDADPVRSPFARHCASYLLVRLFYRALVLVD